MALKTFKPTTPGQRQLVLVDRIELRKGKPVKTLTEGLRSKGGRNNYGRITVRWRGGGHKRRYRIVDFKRRKFDMPATVERLEYDPNRTAFIALIQLRGRRAGLHPGAAAPAGRRQGRLGRAGRRQAGQRDAAAQHAGRHDRPQCRDEAGQGRPDRALRRHLCPARRPRRRAMRCCACPRARCAWCAPNAWRRSARSPTPISRTSSSARPAAIAGSASKPSVRGVAMNPIDHPHGGGEGRTSGGRHPVTPWGKPTKGKKTRHNKKTDGMILRRRRVGK